jgi:hypothetical protein
VRTVNAARGTASVELDVPLADCTSVRA